MNLASYITISRLPLSIFMLLTFYEGGRSFYLLTLGLFAIAVFSDVLDGYVARKFNQCSEFGGRLDALVDKIMIHSMTFSLFYAGVYNPAIVFAAFFRDMIADGLRNHAYEKAAVARSNVWGKAKFACQSLSICFGLLYCTDHQVWPYIWLANAFLVLGFVLSIPGLLNITLSASSTLVGESGRAINRQVPTTIVEQ